MNWENWMGSIVPGANQSLYQYSGNTKISGRQPQQTWLDDSVSDLDLNAIVNRAMEKVRVKKGDQELELDYDTLNMLLLLLDTIMEMDNDNELARVFKTKLAMQKISGENSGNKS